MKHCIILITLNFMLSSLNAQDVEINNKLEKAHATGAFLYVASILVLNEFWYSDYPKASFHLQNDNSNWLQIDKMGHFTSAYHSGLVGMDLYNRFDNDKKKSMIYGGFYGAFFLTSIELLDGFSKEWGASWGDLVANTSGSLFLVGQELLWKEQRIQAKFSFYPTKFPDKNPALLGENLLQQSVKDYNGQTYWLSFNLNKLTQEKRLPKWLNIAFGYGGTNMQYSNYDKSNIRQYYLSFDVDLRSIDTNSKLLNKILKAFSFIKIPAPTFSFYRENNINNIKFYPVFYGQDF